MRSLFKYCQNCALYLGHGFLSPIPLSRKFLVNFLLGNSFPYHQGLLVLVLPTTEWNQLLLKEILTTRWCPVLNWVCFPVYCTAVLLVFSSLYSLESLSRGVYHTIVLLRYILTWPPQKGNGQDKTNPHVSQIVVILHCIWQLCGSKLFKHCSINLLFIYC